MDKKTFLAKLQEGLQTLPQEELRERLSFYSEMIDDRMEEGLSEEEAVEQAGPVEAILAQLPEQTPVTPPAKAEKPAKRRLRAWEIVLLVLGSPVWVSLLVAVAAVILAVYIALWAVVICLWSVPVALAGCTVGGLILTGVQLGQGNMPAAVALLGGVLVCLGLAILLFMGCKAATRGLAVLTKKSVLYWKNRRKRKEEIQ